MASQFIGLQMLVTLHDPPIRLRGIVSHVEAGAGLTLSNVWNLERNTFQPAVRIDAANIQDLQDLTEVGATAYSPSIPSMAPPKAPSPARSQATAPAPFVDPAIVSMGAKPASKAMPNVAPASAPVSQQKPPDLERTESQRTIPAVRVSSADNDATPTGVLSESMKTLDVSGGSAQEPVGYQDELKGPESGQQDSVAAAAGKRRRKPRQAKSAHKQQQEDTINAPVAGQAKAANRGKGWRETPMLQSTASFQPYNSLKRSGMGRQRGRPSQDNGWMSEDVTDVQEMGDFDFESELAKFDKRTLFDQMRKDDEVDDADRLVSHNRLPAAKPGTAGGKNLHHSENVLDLPSSASKPKTETGNDFWNSEADDGILNGGAATASVGGERLSGRDGSRQSSRRGENQVSSTRRSQSRKASATTTTNITVPGQAPSRVNSGQLANRTRTAPRGLYLQPSGRPLETISALQMLNLENIAHNELGLTEDMMTENAGRGIAEVTLTALADPAIQVRTAGTARSSFAPVLPTIPPPPTVVILAGNNKSGIRAVAAGRHLRNKGVTVLVCAVGIERGERDMLEDMRQQLRLFRNFGGRVYGKAELFEHLRKASIPTIAMDAPRGAALTQPPPAVTLIVDALLGLAISFEELRMGDQATVYELIEWANRNEAFALAVDVPTGIDPSSGRVSIVDGSPLYVRPRYVVALGAPKRGLLDAITASEVIDTPGPDHPTNSAGAGAATGAEPAVGTTPGETTTMATPLPDDSPSDWKLFVADIGLGAAVWKKAGTKLRRGVDFDYKWVLEVRYQGTVTGLGPHHGEAGGKGS